VVAVRGIIFGKLLNDLLNQGEMWCAELHGARLTSWTDVKAQIRH
jgi:hypothetical protein